MPDESDQFTIKRIPDFELLPFEKALKHAKELADSYIWFLLNSLESPVAKAMLYASQGGKGLRAFLVIEGARLFDIDRGAAQPAAAAIEAMHAYSLVHDDLPCMDNDDMRRGKLTAHVNWNEHTAVLAGDALQSLAFQCLARTECSAERRLQLFHSLSVSAGVQGMVGGQEMDIAAEASTRPFSLDDIARLQEHKTGALIKWASTAGAVMAGEKTLPLETFGNCLGLAFQIADDILDIEGEAETLGKATGKDTKAGKATFVSHLGVDGAKRRAEELVITACDSLSYYGTRADCLKDAAHFAISRRS